MKRAVLLFGAGASIEYGVPSTLQLTEGIEAQILSDEYMTFSGGDQSFKQIKDQLSAYLKGPDAVNFEHIYHCAHELISMFPPSQGAVNEYRPLLFPFINNPPPYSQETLAPLCGKIIKFLYDKISSVCGLTPQLDPLSHFLQKIRQRHVTRIYTTNYDDFILQAAPDLYTGFDSAAMTGPKSFEMADFWNKEDIDSVSYLHGCVYLSFPHALPEDSDIGDLYWFDDRDEALQHANFHGSKASRMDGTGFLRTAIITGLDKLSRIQQRPMCHYYAALARDLMRADIIYVIGSSLSDLHLNTWLREARTRKPPAPLLFIDRWDRPILGKTEFKHARKETILFHTLNVLARGLFGGTRFGNGWTISPDNSSAIWDRGFQAFLEAPDDHAGVLEHLGYKP